MALSPTELIQFKSLMDWGEMFHGMPGLDVIMEPAAMTAKFAVVNRQLLEDHLFAAFPSRNEAEAWFNYISKTSISLHQSTQAAQGWARIVASCQPLKHPVMPPEDVEVFAVAKARMGATSSKDGRIILNHSMIDETNTVVLCSLAVLYFDQVATSTGLTPEEIVNAVAHTVASVAKGTAMPVDQIHTLNRVTDSITTFVENNGVDLTNLIAQVSAAFFILVLAHEYAHVLAGHHHGKFALPKKAVIESEQSRRTVCEHEADLLAVLTYENFLNSHNLKPNKLVIFLSILSIAMLQLPSELYSDDTGKKVSVSDLGYFDINSRVFVFMDSFFSETWLEDESFRPFLSVLAHLPLFQKLSLDVWNRTK